MKCIHCGKDDELRFGTCFDCATAGEQMACNRTVLQHLFKFCHNVWRGKFEYARFDIKWAWQRMTNTGDYLPGGYFDHQFPGWRGV